MNIILLDSGMGVLPFINEILLQNKLNNYFIYLDEENFPYGNKSREEIFLCYKKLIDKVSIFKPDLIFIACNTLSTVKDENPLVKDVLSFNIKANDNNSYYVSTCQTAKYLKSIGINNVIPLKDLAFLIESRNIKKIIELIKKTKFPSSIILSCTHYPLIKNLFIRYSKAKVFSYEKEIIAGFPSSNKMNINFYTNKKDFYQKFFNQININFISKT